MSKQPIRVIREVVLHEIWLDPGYTSPWGVFIYDEATKFPRSGPSAATNLERDQDQQANEPLD